jgi:hypothetical protein
LNQAPVISSSTIKPFSSKSDKRSEISDEPVKFLGSNASLYQTSRSRTGSVNPDEVPWFQTYVVVGSVAIFLIYFCILREEVRTLENCSKRYIISNFSSKFQNDLDRELETSLFDRVPGLEQTQLVVNYRYNQENKKDNSIVVKRMQELGMNPKDYD